MPGFNGMGPENAGSLTGKGRGYCMKEIEPGKGKYAFFGSGRRLGRRFGGRGARCWGFAAGQGERKDNLPDKKEV